MEYIKQNEAKCCEGVAERNRTMTDTVHENGVVINDLAGMTTRLKIHLLGDEPVNEAAKPCPNCLGEEIKLQSITLREIAEELSRILVAVGV